MRREPRLKNASVPAHSSGATNKAFQQNRVIAPARAAHVMTHCFPRTCHACARDGHLTEVPMLTFALIAGLAAMLVSTAVVLGSPPTVPH